MPILRLFTDHPHAVGETYLQHMMAALSFTGPLFAAALASLTHAIFPFLCTTTASQTIRTLNARLHPRRPTALPRRDPYLAFDPGI